MRPPENDVSPPSKWATPSKAILSLLLPTRITTVHLFNSVPILCNRSWGTRHGAKIRWETNDASMLLNSHISPYTFLDVQALVRMHACTQAHTHTHTQKCTFIYSSKLPCGKRTPSWATCMVHVPSKQDTAASGVCHVVAGTHDPQEFWVNGCI